MKKIGILMAMFFVLAVSMPDRQAMAVNVYGEGAYSDTDNDVQVCIFADIDSSEALRSFGVKLVYNSDEISYDDTKSTRNEAVWHLRDEDGVDHPCTRSNCGPKDVEVSASEHAVVIIGGFLDGSLEHPDEGKVAGHRVLLGTVWFTRASGSGPLTNSLTLELGKVDSYANFVVGPEEGDVLDDSGVTFGDVPVYERGDANGSGGITPRDINAVKINIGVENAPCYVDCDGNGSITPRDINCVKGKIN